MEQSSRFPELACAAQRQRAGAGARDQPAAGDLRGAVALAARHGAGAGEHRSDHSGPRPAGAVLPGSAGDFAFHAGQFRLRFPRPRFPARAAGADALFDAAGVAQHDHRAGRHRSGSEDGGARRRHDAKPVAVPGRAAAGGTRHHGRHPHRRGMGDRHSHPRHADRPDQPGQLHLHRPAGPRTGCSCCSASSAPPASRS